jgi:hypothetical protein
MTLQSMAVRVKRFVPAFRTRVGRTTQHARPRREPSKRAKRSSRKSPVTGTSGSDLLERRFGRLWEARPFSRIADPASTGNAIRR